MCPRATRSSRRERWAVDRGSVPQRGRAGLAGRSDCPSSRQSALAGVAVQPSLASCRRGPLTILCEIAGIVRRAAAAVAAFAALAPRLYGPRPVMGKIARTFLAADTSRPGGFLTVQRKVATIGNGPRFRHSSCLPAHVYCPKRRHRARVALPLCQPPPACRVAARRNRRNWPPSWRFWNVTRGAFHAAIREREVEPGVFRAEYPDERNREHPDEQELPDYHIVTSVADVPALPMCQRCRCASVADVKLWTEQLARNDGL